LPETSKLTRLLEQAILVLLGLALAGIPLFFDITTYDQFELPKVVAMRLLTVVLLALWAWRLALSRTWEWRRTPLDLPVAVWTLWLLVKTVFSVTPAVSWRGEYENFAGSLTQCNYSLLYFIATQHVRTRDQVRSLLLAFLAGAGGASLYALFQALGMDFVGWSSGSVIQQRFFSSLGNPNFLGALTIMAMPVALTFGLDSKSAERPGTLWAFWASQAAAFLGWLLLYLLWGAGHDLDLPGLFSKAGNPSLWVFLASFASLVLAPVLLFLDKRAFAKWALTSATLLVLFQTLLNTGTRGAFLGLPAVAVALAATFLTAGWSAFRKNFSPARLAAFGGVLLAALTIFSFLLGGELSRRMVASFSHPFQAADQSRLQIWIPAFKIWKAYPFTGSGVDTFKTVFPHFSSPKFSEYDGANVSSRMAHCEPLQVLSTMGLIGLALWGWLLFTWARACKQRFKATQDREEGLLLTALGTAWLAYLVQNLVSFGVVSISLPFWLMMAMLWGMGSVAPRPTASCPQALRIAVGILGLGILVLGLPAAAAVFRADQDFNQGHLVSSQAANLEAASLDEARNFAGYALQELDARVPYPRPAYTTEAQRLFAALKQAEDDRNANPARPDLRTRYVVLSRGLMNLLAAVLDQRAVDRCPGEVKYVVYLGLGQEELYKLERGNPLGQGWFDAAQASYARSAELNPQNAYYRGNLGRLMGLKLEAGDKTALDQAREYYLQAIRLAPVTVMFYQNLMQLETLAGKPENALNLAQQFGTDPDRRATLFKLASRLLAEDAKHLASGQTVQAKHLIDLSNQAMQQAGGS
jgi:O-antigen ligase